ncbi:hypothetical protein [Nocardioides sp.]|uniref:hypothetical protein n=1 Tax=Nocardioides sp. TaxID=35761 RepID=UPI002BF7938C|nr:hypothetical protein [Nocardioides sp.]HSX66272.1 hypothetical protein [Nocardioides sp.]
MLRQLIACSTIVTTVALAGCSEAAPDPAATSRTPDPDVMVTVGAADDTSWDYCMRPGRVLLIRSLRVDGGTATFGEPVFNSDGGAITPNVSWAPVQTPVDGYLLTGARPADAEVEKDVAWAARKPLEGAALADGDYALFVQARVRPGTALRDGSLTWTAGEDEGTATTPWHVRFEETC